MRKTQMALAAVALVASTAAMANGVTVSGRFDAGYMSGTGSSDLNGSTGNGTPTKQLNTGLLAPNFLGFSGSENLDNGMKAQWSLLTIMNSAGGATAATGFNSAAIGVANSYVGLSGDFGTVRLGQTTDSFWGNGVANFDVSGGSNIGSAVSAVFMHTASPVFTGQSVQYVSPDVSGMTVAATYSVAGTANAGVTTDAGNYSVAGTGNFGSMKVGAGYSSMGTASNTSSFVAAGTDLGIAKVNALYLNSDKVAGVTGAKATTFGVNAEIPLVGSLVSRVGYYSTDGSAINGSNTHATLLYNLSGRTTVFGNYENATGLSQLGRGNGGYGTKGSIYTLGVAHSF